MQTESKPMPPVSGASRSLGIFLQEYVNLLSLEEYYLTRLNPASELTPFFFMIFEEYVNLL